MSTGHKAYELEVGLLVCRPWDVEHYIFWASPPLQEEHSFRAKGLLMMRLVAFILLCIGIEIMWTGWAELNHLKP
jgi:hypothetical protein